MIYPHISNGYLSGQIEYVGVGAEAPTQWSCIGTRAVPRRERKLNTVVNTSTDGEYHDLGDILESAFKASPVLGLAEGRVTIGWYGSRNIIRKGKLFLAWYSSRKKHIRVNRILDQSWVPSYYIRSIVAHEILHHLIPWVGREFHSPRFLRAERALPGYRRANKWYEGNVNKLLGQNGPNPR